MREFIHRQVRALRAFMHSKDALVYLSFVLLATVIWFANAFSTRRTVTMTIPVHYTHIPDDYIFTEAPTNYVHVTVEDEGVDLFANRKRLFELTFDLSEHLTGEEGTFVIPLDELRQAITQQLVGDASLTAFAPELLTGSYTRQHEKIVPVVYTGQVKPAAQHQLCDDITLTPDSVRVYGTEQDIAAITHVETALTDYEGVQDTFLTRLALIAPKGLRVVPDSVWLKAVAEQFTERAMQLTIRTPDMNVQGKSLRLFPDKVNVTFRIGTAWFSSVRESDIEAYVNMPQKGVDHLPVLVECHNPHITHIRVKPQEVEYLIESYETPTDGGSAEAVPED